ncbi:YecA family protein [Nannocystis exedens]|uniref:YecA family protein n=1 Tax=Nannocystis exedens TaxID=54 RepID=UPI0014756419|nr:SEC-C metal-binding domain-containing protein [Nannocystis exedens]
MGKIGRNESCPCGSGRKYKRCCLLKRPTRATAVAHASAQARLRALLAEPRFNAIDDALHEVFYGPAGVYIEHDGSVSECLLATDTFKSWVVFDVPREDGSFRVDELLRGPNVLPPEERRYLLMMRATVMRLYEVVDVEPGYTITVRDVLDGREVFVYETVFSLEVQRGDLVAARVIQVGPSGLPEINGGFLPQHDVPRDRQRAELVEHLAALRRERPQASDTDLLKTLPPFFYRRWQAWREAQLGPPVPQKLRVIDSAAARREADRDAEELHLERHFARWLDEPEPTLNGLTPLQAAREEDLRPRLVESLRELEDRYKVALRRQEPAYDPSWLWQQLDLRDEDEEAERLRHPPPLGHEMLEAGFPGLKEAVAAIVGRIGGEEKDRMQRTYSRDDLARDPAYRRYVLDGGISEALRRGDAAPTDMAEQFAIPLELCCNFELHLRKVFWVDERLSWTLGVVDSRVAGDMLRVPFPAFALVFTDRHALGLAERLVSRMSDDARWRGVLRVVTVYVIEFPHSADRRCVRLFFACDALDLRGPYLIQRDLWIESGASLDTIVHDPGPGTQNLEDPLFCCAPLEGLLRLVINALLHATSAESESQRREPPAKRAEARPRGPARHYSSETIHFLPGKIDISLLRRIQQVIRGGGGELLHRSLVRGHFRGPHPAWKDQRIKFIEPYWRGPPDSSIVERPYRLKP